MSIHYVSTKFDFNQSTKNQDLVSDRNNWTHKNTKHPHIETDTLSIYKIGRSKNEY